MRADPEGLVRKAAPIDQPAFESPNHIPGEAMRKILYLLYQLSDSDLDWLIARGTKRRVAAGETLIQQGKNIDALYILLDGILEVSGTPGGKPIRLSSGEVVGEVSLLDSRPPTATVTAASGAVLLEVPRRDLMRKLADDDGFAARFYHSMAVFLAHRLRSTYQRLGYGKGQSIDEDAEYDDELSPEMLDTVHLARARFDRALQRLLNE